MRKKLLLVCVFSILLVLTFSMCACNKDTSKLPTTAYEKVQFAFNGVTQTFTETVSSKNNVIVDSYSNEDVSTLVFNSINIPTGISKVEAVYTDGDSQGDVIDELEYYQPPMIQFQCLKAVLEKIGENYQFGEKYYNDMTGLVYFDMADGKAKEAKDENNNYKYNYTFRLAMTINIDANDLITADISFNITLTKGSDTYQTEWYVNMELDYDMKNTTPNYTLTMYTANDESALSFRKGYGYEYDYVEVKNNKINEWRKFFIEANQKLVKDNNHQNIQSYTADSSFEFEANTAKIYKNNNLRKITKTTNEKQLTLANIFFQDIGLNSTDIDSTAFVGKNGIKANEITEFYSEIGNIFKQDVIYSLVCVNEDGHKDGGGDQGGGDQGGDAITQITVHIGTESSSEAFDNRTLNDDVTMLQALTQNKWDNNTMCPSIYVHHSNRPERIGADTFSSLTYKVQIGDATPVVVPLDGKISEALGKFSSPSATSFKLIITSQNDVSVTINCIIGDNLKDAMQDSDVKPEVLALGFPAFPDENAVYSKVNGLYIITNLGDKDMDYRGTLEDAGFAEVNHGNVYAKVVENGKLLYVNIYAYYSAESRVELQVKDVSTTWDQATVNTVIDNKAINLTGPTGANIAFEYVTTGDYKRVIVYGLTETEKNNYFESLDNGTTQFVTRARRDQGSPIVFRVVDEPGNKYYEVDLIENYANLEISLSPYECTIERYTFKIGTGEQQQFSVDLSGGIDATLEERSYIIRYKTNTFELKENDVIYIYRSGTQLTKFISYDQTAFEAYDNGLKYIQSGNYYHIEIWENYEYYEDEQTIHAHFYTDPDPSSPKS